MRMDTPHASPVVRSARNPWSMCVARRFARAQWRAGGLPHPSERPACKIENIPSFGGSVRTRARHVQDIFRTRFGRMQDACKTGASCAGLARPARGRPSENVLHASETGCKRWGRVLQVSEQSRALVLPPDLGRAAGPAKTGSDMTLARRDPTFCTPFRTRARRFLRAGPARAAQDPRKTPPSCTRP